MSLKKPKFKPVKPEQVQSALSKSEKRIFEKGSRTLFARPVQVGVKPKSNEPLE